MARETTAVTSAAPQTGAPAAAPGAAPASAPAAAAAPRRGRPPRATVACIPPALPSNPYLHLLYGALAAQGIEQAADARLELGWLWRRRRRVRALHLHWPEGLYRHERGPRSLRAPLSWAKLGLFAARLAAARALGYRVVWTVHQPRPHETRSRTRDAIAGWLLGKAAHALVAHEQATARQARSLLRVPERRIAVIPHGSYLGVYPQGRPRAAVRAALGVPGHAFLFLCFGELRPYKGVELLLDALRKLPAEPPVALVVAGHPKHRSLAARVEAAAALDRRIVPLLRFVEAREVGELFGAADAAVVPRSDGGTSGSLVLALSQGVPVVAAGTPGNVEVLRGARAGWLFRPGDATSLCSALAGAAADRNEALARGRAAGDVALALAWPGIAARTAEVLVPGEPGGARPRPRPRRRRAATP